MNSVPHQGDQMREEREREKRYIRVVLTDRDREKLLRRAVTASGGLQSLLRRLQAGVRMRGANAVLTMNESDAQRVARYWAQTGGRPGSGGYQSMLPIESLRPYLPSVAPLFRDDAPVARGVSWVYFKRQKVGGDGRIKIGRGGERRSSSGLSTDNPNPLIVLLRLPESDELNERLLHQRFARLRIRTSQEWFWPGDELLEFIDAETAKQKLQE